MSNENSDNLLTFISNLSGINHKRVEEDFGEGFVRLGIAEAERRQAKHDIRTVEDVVAELLRNSRDAEAKKIFVAFHKKNAIKRHVVIIDDGSGIPPSMQEKIFEPRVTSKLDSVTIDSFGVHGRGMALYSIKSVVVSAHVVHSQPGRGSIIEVVADTGKLAERKDQSCFPTIKKLRGKRFAAKGPHNVPRLLVEFSLSHPQLEIFFGSPTQILATIFGLTSAGRHRGIEGGVSSNNAEDCLGCSDAKLWSCLSSAPDAAALSRLAREYYGLNVSERNAWRILGGEIKPLSSVVSCDSPANLGEWAGDIDQAFSIEASERRNVVKCIPQEELDVLSQALQASVRDIERKYFLKIQGKPRVSKSKDQINITIRFARDDN